MVTATRPGYRLISDHVFAAVQQNIESKQNAFFAKREYLPGDVVAEFSAGAILKEPTYLTVQIGLTEHILLQPEHLQYINHSCDPNVFFDTYLMKIVALKQISTGDEMTFFYPSTEWDMAQPFDCHCGCRNCLGQIRGAAHINQDIIKTYTLTRFIQQQLHDRSNREKRA
ncbi:SET domain-containing protein-lysine N-methyltransferase [Terrimonas sp. NA20]|uniref:SET domain-containing protein-lysine N-methyltransferase n=1 Tax=Terrimonas ginsenosidimutans TaxID=2908004 RepID=A0ABS9KKZ5_9BACT|nr:SET domain-containing protein-lysine N-methyltransferase [Terrimonas ginsenosidimutans]MCG2612998.1 SET domain-containing protein-lysine N-methyltransferase [Terrimonas ginsenosidimutans]